MNDTQWKLVILESPYAGEIEANVAYARECVRDCVLGNESPQASHLLFTQPGILHDEVPEERALGIAAGLAWQPKADYSVFYTDRGWSRGMIAALRATIPVGYDATKPNFRLRALHGSIQMPPHEFFESDLWRQKIAFAVDCANKDRPKQRTEQEKASA